MIPIVERKFIILKSARVILDDKTFLDFIQKNKYSYIILISHNQLDGKEHVSVKSKKTLLIDIHDNIDTILSKFSDTSRNEVRRTFKMPELVFSIGNEDFEKIYGMYKVFRKSKNMIIHEKNFLKDTLIFKAHLDGELVSVITCYDAYPHLRIQNIFSKLSGGDKDLRRLTGYATRRLIYEICKYGNKKGFRSLDLAGINTSSPRKAGITQFKKSFGGDIATEYTYTYKSPLARALTFWN